MIAVADFEVHGVTQVERAHAFAQRHFARAGEYAAAKLRKARHELVGLERVFDVFDVVKSEQQSERVFVVHGGAAAGP